MKITNDHRESLPSRSARGLFELIEFHESTYTYFTDHRVSNKYFSANFKSKIYILKERSAIYGG